MILGFSTLLFIVGLIITIFSFSLLHKNKNEKYNRSAKVYISIGLLTMLSPFILVAIYTLISSF